MVFCCREFDPFEDTERTIDPTLGAVRHPSRCLADFAQVVVHNGTPGNVSYTELDPLEDTERRIAENIEHFEPYSYTELDPLEDTERIAYIDEDGYQYKLHRTRSA